jgi:hypothetical protein
MPKPKPPHARTPTPPYAVLRSYTLERPKTRCIVGDGEGGADSRLLLLREDLAGPEGARARACGASEGAGPLGPLPNRRPPPLARNPPLKPPPNPPQSRPPLNPIPTAGPGLPPNLREVVAAESLAWAPYDLEVNYSHLSTEQVGA